MYEINKNKNKVIDFSITDKKLNPLQFVDVLYHYIVINGLIFKPLSIFRF